MHRNQRGRAAGFPVPIEFVGDAIVIGLEDLRDARELVALLRPMFPGTAVDFAQVGDSGFDLAGGGVEVDDRGGNNSA